MMHAMPVIFALVGYFVFSAAVGAMNPPTEQQKASFYGWFYRFAQRLAANADRLVEARFGGIVGNVGEGAAAVTVASSTSESSSITVAANGK